VRTLLVEKLVECQQLQLLADSLPVCQRADVEQRIADCEEILNYLKERFAELNRGFSELYAASSASFCREACASDAEELQADELAGMDDAALLRYGCVLKYIVSVEASLQDIPLDASRARLREAQIEWRRRFGKTVIADSI
jgi:hypothetical protein